MNKETLVPFVVLMSEQALAMELGFDVRQWSILFGPALQALSEGCALLKSLDIPAPSIVLHVLNRASASSEMVATCDIVF